MSVECAEVTNQAHSEMHQENSELPTLDSYLGCKLNRTADTKFVNSYSDMIRIYSVTVCLLNT